MTVHLRTAELKVEGDLRLRSVAPAALRPTELTLVAPTFNEAANLIRLIASVSRALEGVAWELIVGDDDPPDGTARLARRRHGLDRRVRVLRRIGRRGLAGAWWKLKKQGVALVVSSTVTAGLQWSPCAWPTGKPCRPAKPAKAPVEITALRAM